MTRTQGKDQQCVRGWTFPAQKVLLNETSEKVSIRITDLSKSKILCFRGEKDAD